MSTDRSTLLIAGDIPPQRKDDFDLLYFVGGVRRRPWPEKWVNCKMCSTEMKVTAVPGGDGSWLWPSTCQPCIDRHDSKWFSKYPNTLDKTKTVRDPYND